MKKLFRNIMVTTLVISIAGCAANGQRGMAQGDDECSAAKSAGAGALIGALIGAAVDGRKGALRGAAAGAAVGGFGCMAMNHHTKKIRSAQQVNQEYVAKNEQLPPTPTVTQYSLKAPRQAVRGNPVAVNSSITLVDGQNETVNRVEEKLYIVDSANKRKQIKSKEAQNTGMNTGGEYSNSFSFTPPEGVAEGNYRLETEVFVNDRLVKTANSPLMLAYDKNGVMVIALAE